MIVVDIQILKSVLATTTKERIISNFPFWLKLKRIEIFHTNHNHCKEETNNNPFFNVLAL